MIGSDLFEAAGVLGKPSVDDFLSRQQGWHRVPEVDEVLLVNEDTSRLHSLRPPLGMVAEESLPGRLAMLQQAHAKTWCGWRITAVKSRRQHTQTLAIWSPALASLGTLCPRCFGKPPDAADADAPNFTSSSSESDD